MVNDEYEAVRSYGRERLGTGGDREHTEPAFSSLWLLNLINAEPNFQDFELTAVGALALEELRCALEEGAEDCDSKDGIFDLLSA